MTNRCEAGRYLPALFLFITERGLGKQGEIREPLGSEKEATPPGSRACPGVLIPFLGNSEQRESL
ncbi:MAG: hypothetical protein JEY71_10495 [Sphaerochaeta sp.]|nr:hypothetical protein [Sphaerochaeta sp.]